MSETARNYSIPFEGLAGAEQAKDIHFDAIHLIEYEVLTTPIHSEQHTFPQSGVNALFDVNNLDYRRPNTPGLMGITAVAKLINAGVSQNVIISGTHYKGKGEDERRISELYADELRKRIEADMEPEQTQYVSTEFGLDYRGVNKAVASVQGVTIYAESEVLSPNKVDKEGSKDTGGDVSFLQRELKKHPSWKNILVVAYDPHIKRISTLLQNRGLHVVTDKTPAIPNEVNVTIMSSNDILQDHDAERVDKDGNPISFKELFEESPYRQQEGTRFEDSEKSKLAFMYYVDKQGRMIEKVAKLLPQSLKQKVQS